MVTFTMGFIVEIGRYLSCGHLDLAVEEVLSEVIEVVVVQVDLFHRVIVVVDLHEPDH